MNTDLFKKKKIVIFVLIKKYLSPHPQWPNPDYAIADLGQSLVNTRDVNSPLFRYCMYRVTWHRSSLECSQNHDEIKCNKRDKNM